MFYHILTSFFHLKSSFQSASPTLHAFSHALDSLLAFARANAVIYLGKGGHQSPSLNDIWGVCEDIADMLTACADVCQRVSASKGYRASTSQRLPGHGQVTRSISSHT